MNYFRSRIVLALAGITLAAGSAMAAYPDRPITFVVPFGAGSGTDKLARVLAEEVSRQVGQTVVVENKGGASGFIAAQDIARAKPDGYRIFVTSNTTHASNSALFKKLPYDPVGDFAPISKLGNIPLVLVVNPQSIPAKTVPEFIEHLQQNPDKVFFGSGSTSARIGGELFKILTNTKISNVDYKSNPQAVVDTVGGQIQMMIADAATTLPLARDGKLRALAVSTSKRTEIAPDLPTLAESGVKGYEMVAWFASYAPAGTPDDVIKTLNQAFVKTLSDPKVVKNLQVQGIEAEASSPEELAAFQKAETEKWVDIVAKAGVEVR
ncbi:Bug family tripartite tricarboxylate transporter substrate binding protein [Advenella mimigardefordensis]